MGVNDNRRNKLFSSFSRRRCFRHGLVSERKTQKGRIISHGDPQPGASIEFQILLDKDVVCVVMSNAFGTKRRVYKCSSEMANLRIYY